MSRSARYSRRSLAGPAAKVLQLIRDLLAGPRASANARGTAQARVAPSAEEGGHRPPEIWQVTGWCSRSPAPAPEPVHRQDS